MADFDQELLDKAAQELKVVSYKVVTRHVDVSTRDLVRSLSDAASALASVVQVVDTAGVSSNMAPPERVLAADLYGNAIVFAIVRPARLNNKDEIDYGTTKKGQMFKNATQVISRRSVATLVVKLATQPGLSRHTSLGIHKV